MNPGPPGFKLFAFSIFYLMEGGRLIAVVPMKHRFVRATVVLLVALLFAVAGFVWVDDAERVRDPDCRSLQTLQR